MAVSIRAGGADIFEFPAGGLRQQEEAEAGDDRHKADQGDDGREFYSCAPAEAHGPEAGSGTVSTRSPVVPVPTAQRNTGIQSLFGLGMPQRSSVPSTVAASA